jgi:hypothetical protein
MKNYKYIVTFGNDQIVCYMNGIKYRLALDSSLLNTHRELSVYTYRMLSQYTYDDLENNEEIGVTE